MALPGTYANPHREASDLQDEKNEEAYEEGHDADLFENQHGSATKDDTQVDIEKGLPSNRESTISRETSSQVGATAAGTEAKAGGEEIDPDVVDWDGPDDPANPQNWTPKKKWCMIAALAATTLVTLVRLPILKRPN